MKFFKKGIVLVIALTIISGLVPVGVKAQVPTVEHNPSVITSVLSTAGSTAKNLVQSLFEWAQKLLIERLRRQLLNMLVDEMVGFINDGEPRVIADWQSFLFNASAEGGNDVSNQIAGADLCPEFAPQLTVLMGATSPVGSSGGSLDCTRSNSPAGNSGWGSFIEGLEPENSFISSYLIAESAKSNASQEAREAAATEGIAGGGFLSDKQSGVIVTPGSVLKDLASKAVGSEIDYVLNADSLDTYVNAVVNSMFNNVLDKGLALVQPQKDQTINTGITTSDYVSDISTINQISANKFADERSQLRASLRRAITDRKAGQAFYDNSQGSIVASEVDTIISALDWLRSELLRPQHDGGRSVAGAGDDLIASCGDSRFTKIVTIRTDIINDRINTTYNSMAEVLDAVFIADDNNPSVNNPLDTVAFAADGDPSDNLDIIGKLEAYLAMLDGATANTEANRSLMLNIKSDLGGAFELDATNFRSTIEGSLKEITNAENLLTGSEDFAGALAACTQHRSPAGGWSSLTGTLYFPTRGIHDWWALKLDSSGNPYYIVTPTRPFPWEQ